MKTTLFDYWNKRKSMVNTTIFDFFKQNKDLKIGIQNDPIREQIIGEFLEKEAEAIGIPFICHAKSIISFCKGIRLTKTLIVNTLDISCEDQDKLNDPIGFWDIAEDIAGYIEYKGTYRD